MCSAVRVLMKFCIIDINSKLICMVPWHSDKRKTYLDISHINGMQGFISGFETSHFWSLLKIIRILSMHPKTIYTTCISISIFMHTSPK